MDLELIDSLEKWQTAFIRGLLPGSPETLRFNAQLASVLISGVRRDDLDSINRAIETLETWNRVYRK